MACRTGGGRKKGKEEGKQWILLSHISKRLRAQALCIDASISQTNQLGSCCQTYRSILRVLFGCKKFQFVHYFLLHEFVHINPCKICRTVFIHLNLCVCASRPEALIVTVMRYLGFLSKLIPGLKSLLTHVHTHSCELEVFSTCADESLTPNLPTEVTTLNHRRHWQNRLLTGDRQRRRQLSRDGLYVTPSLKAY